MKNDDRLQLPISKKLKKDLQKKFEHYGFSSFNEAIRVFLHNLAYSNQSPMLSMMNDDANEIYIDPYVEIADEKTEKAIAEAYASHKRGESIKVDLNDKDWFEKLVGEN